MLVRRTLSNDLRLIVSPACLIGLISLSIAFSKGTVSDELGVQHTVAVRYWSSVDNKIPGFLARGITNQIPIEPFLFADWNSSDRPPLVSGWLCISKTLLNSKFGEISLLVAAATLVIPIIYVLIEMIGVPKKLWVPVIVLIFSTPFLYTNTVYAWPKLLAGGLFLLAICIFWIDKFPHKFYLVGAICSLLLLTHGSTMFMLPGILFVMAKQKVAIQGYVKMLGSGVVFYAPWFCYQQFWDRTSNRLIYWHIANQPQGTEGESLFASIIANYSEFSIVEVIQMKFNNLINLFVIESQNPAVSATKGFPGSVNAWASETILGSLWPLFASALIGFCCVKKVRIRLPGGLFQGMSVGLFFFVLIEFGGEPDSIASVHIAPLSIIIFLGVLLASYVILVIDKSGSNQNLIFKHSVPIPSSKFCKLRIGYRSECCRGRRRWYN